MVGLSTFTPLGDQAVLIYLRDETAALRFTESVRAANFPWLVDVVPAYASVGIHFDADQMRYAQVERALLALKPTKKKTDQPPRQHPIPCCYEMELDLARVVEQTG